MKTVIRFSPTFTRQFGRFLNDHATKLKALTAAIFLPAFSFAQGMVTGANNLVTAIVSIVNVAFIGLIVYGVITVVKKYVTDEPDAGGAFVRLAIAIVVFTAFTVYQTDIIGFFGGAKVITP